MIQGMANRVETIDQMMYPMGRLSEQMIYPIWLRAFQDLTLGLMVRNILDSEVKPGETRCSNTLIEMGHCNRRWEDKLQMDVPEGFERIHAIEE